MYQAPVRSATATTGKTVLAIVAILSLMLSLFAITQPVAADHTGFDHQPLPIDTSQFSAPDGSDPEDDEDCEGLNLEPGQVLLHWIANHQSSTTALTLTLTLDDGSTISEQSYKWNTDGKTHHFNFIVDGDVIVDDLAISSNTGNVRLSHVCRGEEEQPAPVLEIEKSASSTQVNAGDSVTFTITARNTGDAWANNVSITDDLDDSLTDVTATYSYPDGSGSHPCDVAAENVVTCDEILLKGAGEIGDDVVVTIMATTSEHSCPSFDNVATIDSDETDAMHSNTVTVHVICEEQPAPDLTITKTSNVVENTAAPGTSFTYFVTVTNNGDATATGVVVTDDLNDHLTVTNTTYGYNYYEEPVGYRFFAEHTCDVEAGTNVVTCDLGQLNAAGTTGDAAQIKITVSVPSEFCGDLANTASVHSTEGGDLDSNTVTVHTATCEEEPLPGQIVIKKDVLPETVDPSHTFEFDPSYDDNFMLGNGEHLNSGDLTPGTYTVAELEAEGFDLIHIVCDDGESNHPSTGDLETRTATIVVEPGETVTCTFTNAVGDQGPGETGSVTIVKETNPDSIDPSHKFGFDPSWEGDNFELGNGEHVTHNLTPGTYTVTELMADGFELTHVVCEGDSGEFHLSSGDVATRTATVDLQANEAITCTFTNMAEDEGPGEEGGELEIAKFFCPEAGDDQIIVFGPATEEPLDTARVQGEPLPTEDGCTLGADAEGMTVTFVITGADEFSLEVTTVAGEILTVDLAPGDYTITEKGTDLSADFTVVDDGDTAVVVFNYEDEQPAESGRIKILKLACTGPEGVVFTILPGDQTSTDLPTGASDCSAIDATFMLDDGTGAGDPFTLGSDGIRLIPVNVGTYTLAETAPMTGDSDEFDVVDGETTTVIVFNLTADEGTAPGEGTQGGNPGPNEGTLGGNPVPDTAMDFGTTGTVPAAILALLMLSGLGAAAYAVKAEARRRR